MLSDEPMRSEEVANFFEECLREQGLESVQVSHQTSSESFVDEFYIYKDINREERLVHKTTFNTTRSGRNLDTMQKSILLKAEQVAKEFKQQLVTLFEWGDRSVEVCLYDGGWARCTQCGTKVEAPKASYLVTESCELSDPMPVERDMARELENMDEFEKTLLKMYLIGILRESCDTRCPNSKFTERFK